MTRYHIHSDFSLPLQLLQYLQISPRHVSKLPGYSQNANPLGLLVSWSNISLQSKSAGTEILMELGHTEN